MKFLLIFDEYMCSFNTSDYIDITLLDER